MNYFMTGMIDYNLAAPEAAAIARQEVFTNLKADSQLLTVIYNRFLRLNAFRAGLKPEQYVNMFDFFQGSASYNGPISTLADVAFPNLVTPVRQGNIVYYYQGADRIAEVHLFEPDSDFPFAQDQLSTVSFYDRLNNINRTDMYDVRGFKSRSDFYGRVRGQHLETYYNLKGEPVLEITYQKNAADQNEITRLMLTYQQTQHVFDNLAQLQGFFYDQLQQADTRFFVDRAFEVSSGLEAASLTAPVYLVDHDTQRDPASSGLSDAIQAVVHLAKFQGVITATLDQHNFWQQQPVTTIDMSVAANQPGAVPAVIAGWQNILK
ncbi:hypothetical protein [Lacticaseibacillus brantae]|uniref:Uncharacterized protein n=1 Tax=Lacticaseibacillus brantae DSM 23927 TaxID=1423727 RepID=A0A0R2AXR2_9LACO|nr:hypothetical protein [Lacticaseibacillus brantae]KRM71663.1 hypothetical protein FC34_GL001320 [Lacticaseibacillus brantae DSM 23927]